MGWVMVGFRLGFIWVMGWVLFGLSFGFVLVMASPFYLPFGKTPLFSNSRIFPSIKSKTKSFTVRCSAAAAIFKRHSVVRGMPRRLRFPEVSVFDGLDISPKYHKPPRDEIALDNK